MVNKNGDLLTIVCLVYNHDKYLRRTLDGFVNQKCNFKYSIYIQDDCSTDESRKIIQEYKNIYDNIKVFFLEENIHSKGISPFFSLLDKVDTEYIAICEGDDFWIDNSKLQKQVDFLIEHKDYNAVYHNVFVVDDNDKLYNSEQCIFPLYISHEYTIKDFELLSSCCSQSASLVMSNFWKKLSFKEKKIILSCQANGDIKLCLLLLLYGKVWFMEDIMSCYRKSYKNDSWSAKNKNSNLSYYYIESRISLEKMAKIIKNKEIQFDKTKYFLDSLFILKSSFSKENLKIFFKCAKKLNFRRLLKISNTLFGKNYKQKELWRYLSEYEINKYIKLKELGDQ